MPKRIFAVLYVSVMGLTRCYKTTVFYIYISPICGEAPTEAMYMKICVVNDFLDVITCAKFQNEIFRGYNFTGGRILHFSYWFWMGLTTVQRYCAACDTPWFARGQHVYGNLYSSLSLALLKIAILVDRPIIVFRKIIIRRWSFFHRSHKVTWFVAVGGKLAAAIAT